MSYELARRYTRLKPDQAALGGLVNQIGALPVLIYAEEHNELLSDPVCLHHVIELIQPVLGDKILKAWEFPEQLVKLPGLVQDLDRQTDRIDYIDVVQIARCISQRGRERPLAALPAYRHLGLPMGSELHAEDLLEARSLLR